MTVCCDYLCFFSTAEDRFRDQDEATTSDTTIDSPVNITDHEATKSECNGTNGIIHHAPGHAIKAPKSNCKKHRKSRDNKSRDNNRCDQNPLYNDAGLNCNGSMRSDDAYSSSDSSGSRMANGIPLHKGIPKSGNGNILHYKLEQDSGSKQPSFELNIDENETIIDDQSGNKSIDPPYIGVRDHGGNYQYEISL